MVQVFTGASVPLEIERWILENGTKVFEKETIYIDIPQGIDDHEMIILRDRGNIISEQVKGDIKVNILIQNNTAFKRSGLDLIFDKQISLKEALCGFSHEIEHLSGKKLAISTRNNPSVIHPGSQRVFQNYGLIRGVVKGSLIIEFQVEFPAAIDEEKRNKLSEIL